MKLNTLTKAITLATLLSVSCLRAYAADVPLSNSVEADQVVTNVLSVDATQHKVVLEGADGKPVYIQLSDNAKDLDHLKTGDKVQIDVTHSVAVVLDTDVEKGLPSASESSGESVATKNNPNPGGEAFRHVQVQLKITAIDLKKNKLTFENPAGQKKVVTVEEPEVQAHLKNLKVGQSVVVVYTDVLKITTQHEG